MRHLRVPAAKFVSRYLEPAYEAALGGEEAHHLLATAHAESVCPPSGHWISWSDCYASADLYPLPRKADLLLDPSGNALPVAEHLSGEARDRAVAAGTLAEQIRREARRLGGGGSLAVVRDGHMSRLSCNAAGASVARCVDPAALQFAESWVARDAGTTPPAPGGKGEPFQRARSSVGRSQPTLEAGHH